MATAARRSRGRGRFRGARSARRWLAVLVLGLVGVLYYRPLVAYFDARSALERQHAEVASLRMQKHRLERRLRAEASARTLQREARRLGYVKPGEQLFIVKGIAAWRRERARAEAARAARLAERG